LVAGVSFDKLYALGFELGAHGWIHIGIASRYAVAGLPCDGGDAAHKGAANAQDVYMHD
jgi:hypothetical protein